MSQTDGRWSQDLPCTDLQLFRGPRAWIDTSGVATQTQGGNGLFYYTVPTAAAATFVADLFVFQRTGMYGNSAYDQEQFGTAAGVPGPTSVSGTTDADALNPGFPPILAASMATLGSIRTGPTPKGMYLTSLDVIYSVNTVAATLAQVGYYRTTFANGAAPVVSPVIALGTNGLATTVDAAVVKVINIPATGNTFSQATDLENTCKVNLTAGTGGTIFFYGTVSHVSYNIN